jgi:hypothetical protein
MSLSTLAFLGLWYNGNSGVRGVVIKKPLNWASFLVTPECRPS